MDFNEAPALYRSPSQCREPGTLSGNSSTRLLSPLDTPDLTDTVNALTEGYAAGKSTTPLEQSWSQPSFYGHNDAPPSDMMVAGGRDVKPEVSGMMGGLANEGAYQDPYIGEPSQAYNIQTSSINPFANMPTYVLQSYLAGGPSFSYPTAGPGMTGVTSRSSGDDRSTQTLFQEPVDSGTQALGTFVERSPSPLIELDDDPAESVLSYSSSPEPDKPPPRNRRASDGEGLIRPRSTRKARPSVHLPMDEKLKRAQATEGLSKQDKRRVQNKLAQRAFRARSKVANQNVFTRLEHLEELTEQQADRIVKMTELVNRLQRENTGLKTTKFQEAMQGIAHA